MIKKLFTDISAIYDRMNHVFSLGRDLKWRRQAAERVQITPRRILDLAAGTGDFSFALARRFPEAEIVGLDLTPAMLEIARKKNTSPRISFVEGDATALPFAGTRDACPYQDAVAFDLISCAFGFRNIPDKRKALQEARRVLAKEGELLVLEFFRPSCKLLGVFTAIWLKMLVFLFVRSRSAAYGYLRESMKSTLSEKEFIALAEEEGFALRSCSFFFPCCTCLAFGGV